MTVVMWFRRDLRIEDNKALAHAIASGQPIVCLFHVNPDQLSEKTTPSQSRFIQSVLQLRADLAEHGIALHLMMGDWQRSFEALYQRLENWTAVYFNFDEAGFGRLRDQRAAVFFRERGIRIHAYQDHYLHGSQEIKNQKGQAYQVFTPYFKAWRALPKETPVVVDLSLGNWQTLPTEEAVFQKINGLLDKEVSPPVGTANAHRLLEHFVRDGLATYHRDRDYPALEGTSYLSPYLRSGELSIRTVYQAVSQAPASQGQATFIKELAWREFYHMIHVNFPDQKNVAIQAVYREMDWVKDAVTFERWTSGETGYPIVDAAMKQLKTRGWMHNRLRMIVASFLTKDLLMDWRLGEDYFQEMLIDYDAASNIGGWQWAASVGTDAVPYFRIFNPVRQGKQFDPEGQFIKTYLPQLAHVPTAYIHEPWKMSVAEQLAAGCQLGQDYPLPIVDHATQRLKALALYEDAREKYRLFDKQENPPS